MPTTSDRNDPELLPIDPETNMQMTYLVLSKEDRAKGFVEPLRKTYQHEECLGVTTMSLALAETFARQPEFYTGTYCAICRDHFPVGGTGQFVWADTTQKVGTRSTSPEGDTNE